MARRFGVGVWGFEGCGAGGSATRAPALIVQRSEHDAEEGSLKMHPIPAPQRKLLALQWQSFLAHSPPAPAPRQALFERGCQQPGSISNRMGLPGWLRTLQLCGLSDVLRCHVSSPPLDALLVFVWSQMAFVNEAQHPAEAVTLSWPDFLEAFARIADLVRRAAGASGERKKGDDVGDE